jgi:MoxR-like ATPase
MADKLTTGSTVVVHWEANNAVSPASVKSNKTDQGRTKKIMLVADPTKGVQPRPGEIWVCRIVKITKPESENRGAIFVRPLTRKVEDFQSQGVYIEPLTAKLIATVLQDPKRNLMMEGDQGVGKSTIALAIVNSLGWNYRHISGGLIKKFVYMTGRFIPTSDGNNLQFTFADSQLSEALREAEANPSKIFALFIDEYTRIETDARDALLELTEGRVRMMRLPTGQEIKVGQNVVWIAAGNVGEGFTLQQQDAAAKDRWTIVKIDYMPQPEELAHCLRLYPNCPRAELDRALTIVNVLRKARRDPKLRITSAVSTRGSETIAMFLNDGFPIDVALETAVTNQFSGSRDEINSEAGRVAKIIQDELARK